jgi:hypothetical protein
MPSRIQWSVLILLLLTATVGAAVPLDALETRHLLSDATSLAVLNQKIIYAELRGRVNIPLPSAISVLQDPAFLTRAQEEYGRSLPPGTRPEFTVQQGATNAWFYTNKEGERTDITETARRIRGEDSLDLVYYTRGRRFFGEYQALIHIQLAGDGTETEYIVAVYAYPENGVSRFFARHFRLVERYFHGKTDEIAGLAVRLSARLCDGSLTKN